MHIRRATSQDQAVIAAHNIALAAESESYQLDPDTALRGVSTLIQHPEKGFYLVAEEEEDVVGQLMVTYEWSDWRARDIWWLQSIYVKKRVRRRGIMRTLVTTAQDMAAQRGVAALRLYVHSSNQSAIQAYRRLGMDSLPYQLFSLPVPTRQQRF